MSSSSSSKASSASEAETETEVAHPSTSGTSMAAQMEAMNARITLLESKMAKMERSPRCADDNLGVTDKNSKLDNPLFSIKTTNREIEEFFDDSEKVSRLVREIKKNPSMTWHGNEKKDTVVGKILDRLMSIEMQGTRSFQDDKRKLKKDGIPHTLVDWILHLLMEQWESSGVSEDGGNTDFYEDFVKKCKAHFTNSQQKMRRMAVGSGDLKLRITKILRKGDIQLRGEVRTKLEEEIGQSLSSRKTEVNELIDEVTDELENEDVEDNEPIKKQAKRAPLCARKGAGKARAAQIFGEEARNNPPDESEEEDEQIASELAEHRRLIAEAKGKKKDKGKKPQQPAKGPRRGPGRPRKNTQRNEFADEMAEFHESLTKKRTRGGNKKEAN